MKAEAKWWQIWIRSQEAATWSFWSWTENESRITEGRVFSFCGEHTSTEGVFVLLNDRTICSVFTQTVPGSLEETDSSPERWEMILHSHWSLAAFFLSQNESLKQERGRHTARGIWMGNLTTWSQPDLEWERRHERKLFAWNSAAPPTVSSEWQPEEPDEPLR